MKKGTNKNGAKESREYLALKEAFLRSLRNNAHDERVLDELVAAIDGLLRLDPSSAAWILETLPADKLKGTFSSPSFHDLEQRLITALHAPKGDGTATQTTVDDRNDEDTEIETLMISDEDTAVDHELLNNDATTPIDVFADTDSEQSTAVSMATDIMHQGPLKAEGDTLNDRYEITECIGSGSMSKVYKAVDRHKVEAGDSSPFVAVKIFNRKLGSHDDWLQIVQKEAEKCQGLYHPNVVEVFDFDHDGCTVYMVMEFLTGQSLGTKIQNLGFKVMELEEVQRTINEIGRALSFAHLHGVVHGDLKPANVIVNYRGEVKVINFAIAHAFQNPKQTDFDAQFRGTNTPIYASPEVLEHKDPDSRDDIFSLACTAYQLITGRHPFNRMRATEARDIGVRVRRPKKLPEPQWKALRNALCFERDKRTSTVADFLEAFNSRALPRRSIVAISAGVTALIVIAYLVVNQNLIDDFSQSPLVPSSSLQTEKTPVQQATQQQLVSRASRLGSERQGEVVPTSPYHTETPSQAVLNPIANESSGERFQDRRQLQAKQSDEVAVESTGRADLSISDEDLETTIKAHTVSKNKSGSDASSLSTTVKHDQDRSPQQGHIQTPEVEHKPADSAKSPAATLSQTHSATATTAEVADHATSLTEFGSHASVTHTERIQEKIDPRERSPVQGLDNSLETKRGDHQDTPGTPTQTLLAHDEQVLFNSAKHGDLQTIDAIIKSGFPLNSREQSSGATAIIMASRHGHTDVVRALLNAGADVQTQDNKDMTALLWATQGGHFEVVHALSDHGVDTEVRNSAGETALLAAAWDGHQDIVSSLLANGAGVNARNNEGWTALINASINGHVSVVHTLLDSGADPSLTAFDGKTALMAAAWNGHTDIVKVLSKNESTVNMRNADGWTALMNAAWNGHRAAVKILVDTGAEVQSVNVDNHTAAALAASQGHRDIATLLKRVR